MRMWQRPYSPQKQFNNRTVNDLNTWVLWGIFSSWIWTINPLLVQRYPLVIAGLRSAMPFRFSPFSIRTRVHSVGNSWARKLFENHMLILLMFIRIYHCVSSVFTLVSANRGRIVSAVFRKIPQNWKMDIAIFFSAIGFYRMFLSENWVYLWSTLISLESWGRKD